MTTAIDTRAEQLLHELAGPDARFREHQLEAMRDLVEDRARVLCVQRTGWGKSAVYFVATALLRERGRRADADRLAAAGADAQPDRRRASGSGCARTRSTRPTATSGTRSPTLLAADAVDLLLISPERLNNPQFRDDDAAGLRRSASGCSSSTRRTASPTGATTSAPTTAASATCSSGCPTASACCARPRRPTTAWSPTSPSSCAPVATRAAAHLPRRAGRTSLRFEVVELPAQAERLAWLAAAAARAAGLGHRLHAHQARRRPRRRRGSPARASPPRPTAARSTPSGASQVEDRLLRNELKAVVATSALGMGYDKPDLGFVVHYQAPGLGHRLLPAGRPRRPRDRARRGRAAARRRGPPHPGLLHRAGLPAARGRRPRARAPRRSSAATGDDAGAHGAGQPRPGRIEGLLKVLDVEGAVGRDGSRWLAAPGAAGPTTPSATRASPSCAAPSRPRWPPSAPTAAA